MKYDQENTEGVNVLFKLFLRFDICVLSMNVCIAECVFVFNKLELCGNKTKEHKNSL